MTSEVKNKPQLQGFLSTGKVSADAEFFKPNMGIMNNKTTFF